MKIALFRSVSFLWSSYFETYVAVVVLKIFVTYILLQVEAKMQMEQTVAESRLEALYSHYKKNRESSDTDMVAPSAKLRMRIDMQKQQQQHEKEKGDNSEITRSNTVMRQISRSVIHLQHPGYQCFCFQN